MEEKDIGMHVYGYGFNEIADKRDALVPYKYHLAIENGVPHYWTEKTCRSNFRKMYSVLSWSTKS